jgi:hypothetical protein
MTTPSSWLIGSITLASSATIVVNGVSNAVIPAGTYYLYDATASLSLLDVILTAVAPFMTDEAIVVLESRKIRVTASVAFTWTIPTELQDALGFGAAIPSTTSATASAVSDLLWSPGWCATTIGHPGGVTGYEQSQTVRTASPSGLSQRHTTHGTSAVMTSLEWMFVLRSRAWTVGEDNGTPGDYRRFWRVVLNPGLRWKLYPETEEDDASSTPVTWPTALGPYKTMRARDDWWTRAIASTDTHTDVRLEGLVSSEVS